MVRRLRHEIKTPIHLYLSISFAMDCAQSIVYIWANCLHTLDISKDPIKFIGEQLIAKCLILLIDHKLHKGRAPACFAHCST